jgi:hypothetical protein
MGVGPAGALGGNGRRAAPAWCGHGWAPAGWSCASGGGRRWRVCTPCNVRMRGHATRLACSSMRWIPSDMAGVGEGGVAKPPWLRAFAALKSRRLDRVTRHFGWQLLHGALRCGAAVVHWCPADSVEQLQSAVCCPEPSCVDALTMPDGACVPALASLSNIFLHCAAVRPAVDWLRSLWARLAPSDQEVPLDARVLLLGDDSAWLPAGGAAAQELWLHLRLLWCRAVWVVVCRRRAEGVPDIIAAAVVALAARWVERAVRLDWLRASASLPGAAVLPSWCVLDMQFKLTLEQFNARPVRQRRSCSH